MALSLGRYPGQQVQITDQHGNVLTIVARLQDRHNNYLEGKAHKIVLSLSGSKAYFHISRPDRKIEPEMIQLGSFTIPREVGCEMVASGAIGWGAINLIDLYFIDAEGMIVGHWYDPKEEYELYGEKFFPSDWMQQGNLAIEPR